jgi:uncharacterized membrane protein
MIKVLYVGDSAIIMGFELKGIEVNPLTLRYGGMERGSTALAQALKQNPNITVVHIPSLFALYEFPKTVRELEEYDVIILSDVGRDTLLLYPERFVCPMGPNRLEAIKEFVERGGGLLMAGGYFSFQGIHGLGLWKGTPIEEVLPVEILPIFDDRVETPEGVKPTVINPEHPIMTGIPWETIPPFLGYQRLKIKEGATLLAKIKEDPFIVVWEYHQARTMAFASDPCPHWGVAFKDWQYYPKFWIQAIEWLAKRR